MRFYIGSSSVTIYVNDLLSVPEHCISASHVDDCKMYLSFPPDELAKSISAMNDDLTKNLSVVL